MCPLCGFEFEGPRVCARCRAASTGRIRPATVEEASILETIFRPDAVLALTRAVSDDMTASEQRIAGLIDGIRPVARILEHSGSTAAQVCLALAALNERCLLHLAGILEQGDAAPLKLVGDSAAVVSRAEEAVNAEGAGLSSIDDPTDVMPTPSTWEGDD